MWILFIHLISDNVNLKIYIIRKVKLYIFCMSQPHPLWLKIQPLVPLRPNNEAICSEQPLWWWGWGWLEVPLRASAKVRFCGS